MCRARRFRTVAQAWELRQLLNGSTSNAEHESALRQFLEATGRLHLNITSDAAVLSPDKSALLRSRPEHRHTSGDGGPSCVLEFQNRVGLAANRWEGCAADIEAAEAASGRHEWVIQARPDLRWACRPAVASLAATGRGLGAGRPLRIAERAVAGELPGCGGGCRASSCNHHNTCFDHILNASGTRLGAVAALLAPQSKLKQPLVEVATIWQELVPASMIAAPREGEAPSHRERPPSRSDSGARPVLSEMGAARPSDQCDTAHASTDTARKIRRSCTAAGV